MKYIFFFILLFTSTLGWSQSRYKILGTVTNTDMARRESGVTITVTADGAPVSKNLTSNSGKFQIPLAYGKKYKIVFSKPGLASRFLYVDLVGVNIEDVPAGDMIQEFSMSLFGVIPGADLSFLNTMPTTTFSLDVKRMISTFDRKQAADMREKIDKVLAEKEALKAAQEEKIHQYEQLMQEGDQNFAGQKYEDALKNYQDALALLPNEALPKQKIASTQAKIKELEAKKNQAEKEAQYNALIQEADKLFIEKKWNDALAKYQAALKIKPTEQHPTQRIIEIDQILTNIKKAALAAKQKDEQYNNLITAADNLRDQKKYESAKAKYTEAIKIKNEQYPKDQIAAIDLLIKKAAEEKAKNEAYNTAMTAANTLYSQNKLNEAIAKYQEASTIKPNEVEPKQKIAEIKQKLADLAAKEAKEKTYNDAIASGDQLLAQNKLLEAKAQYQKAIGIKPEETYPKNQIAEIDKKIADQKAKQAVEKAYQDKIADADAKFNANALEEAKKAYQEALQIKPEETYPATKIKAIDDKLAALAKEKLANEQYTKLINEANLLLSEQKLEEAKAKYQAASTVKPAETLPKQKIAEIDKKLNEIATQKKLEEDYNNAIATGKTYLASKDLQKAQAQYKIAQSLKPNEALPKDKLAEIAKLIAEKEKQAILDKKYNALVAEADNFFNTEMYADAKTKYIAAKQLKQDPYLDQRIKAIDDKLAEIAALEAKKKAYNDKIILADDALERKEYKNAKKLYEEALAIDPAQSYPKEKIKEIAATLAQQQSAAEREQKFNELVAQGDQLVSDKKLEQAVAKYEEALAVKTDAGVQQKVDNLKAQISMMKEQAGIEEAYQKAINLAQSKENSGDLAGALTAYKQAQSIKPGEPLPAQKITEIQNKLLANTQQAEIDKQFNAAMKAGDELFAAGNYQDAKNKYVLAKSFKNDPIVDQKIALAEQKMKEETASMLEANYQKIIAKADGYKAEKNWDGALKYYNRALSIKPEDEYPKKAIEEIKRLQAEAMKANAEQADIENQYKEAMRIGDQKLNEKELNGALESYMKAESLKPGDAVANQKINLVKKLIKEKMSNEIASAKYMKYMAEGDRKRAALNYQEAIDSYKLALNEKPGDPEATKKIAEAQAQIDRNKSANKTMLFNEWVEKANQAYVSKNYEAALNLYKEALKIKPDSKPVSDKIDEINQILDNIAAQEANADAIEAKYKAIISKADSKFVLEDWNKAQDLYKEALAVKPNDEYAKKQLQLTIDKQKAETSNMLEKQYNKILAKADEYFGEEKWDKAIRLYQRALDLKPNDEYPKKKLDEIERIKVGGGINKVELADLGRQQDISIMDGEALLAKAEIIRKQRQIKKVLAKGETSDAELRRLSSLNRERNLKKSAVIDSIVYAKMLTDVDLTGIHNDIIKKIDSIQVQTAQNKTMNANYDYNDAQNTSEYVKQVVIAKSNTEKDGSDRHQKVVDSLNVTLKNIQDSYSIRSTNEYIKATATNEHIKNVVMSKNETEVKSAAIRNDIEKEIIEIQRKKANKAAQDLQDEYREVKIANAKIVELKANKSNEASEHAKTLQKTNEKVVELNNQLSNKAREDQENAYKTNLETQLEIKRIQSDANNLASEKTKAHKETINEIKKLNDQIHDNNTSAQNKETENVRNTQKEINKIIEDRRKEEANQTDDHQKVINEIKRVENEASQNEREKSTNKKNELLITTQEIKNITIATQKNNSDNGNNAKANAEKVNRITENAAIVKKENEEKAKANREKIENLLTQLASKEIQFNETIANSLAKEFPAGVTEENYPVYGDDGLIISMVTRRIVVKDGRGDVYLKSTTRYGTTYSKNGSPIVQSIWARETQDAKLERH